MNAGEAGADYVMFGEPRRDGFTPPAEETIERVGWWAEIFEPPCVGYAAALDDMWAAIAAAGADFVALGRRDLARAVRRSRLLRSARANLARQAG